MSSRSQRKGFGSPVPLKPERSFGMSVREVVSRIIKDLDVNDTEGMANTVNRVEEIFREGKKCFSVAREWSTLIKTEFFG